MLATSTGAEQRTVLDNISWETFEALLRETGSGRSSRFAYEDGTLEIMTPLFEHENPKINFDRFIFILVEELEIEIRSAGSTTIKKEDLKKGIEPDNCYYIQNELAIRGRETLDFETDPPPDLAIEIDITSSSVNKFSIYSALKVPEIWRYNGSKLKFYELINNKYVERDYSIAVRIQVSSFAYFQKL
jgi:Uma2 family endonuclease